MVTIRYNRNWSIMGVVNRLMVVIMALYVGGTVLDAFGTAMKFTQSGFYSGFSLIGWTVGDYPMYNASHHAAQCANESVAASTVAPGATTCLTDVTSGGVLAVVGIIGLASVVLEFVKF